MTNEIFLHPKTQLEAASETMHLLKLADDALHLNPTNPRQTAARTKDIDQIASDMGPMSDVERASITRNMNKLSEIVLSNGDQKIEGTQSVPVAKPVYEGNELKSIIFRSISGDDSYGREITVDLPHAALMANAKQFTLANGATRTVQYDNNFLPISIDDSTDLSFHRNADGTGWTRTAANGEASQVTDLSVANDGSLNYTRQVSFALPSTGDVNVPFKVHERVAENGDSIATNHFIGPDHLGHDITTIEHEETPKDGETSFRERYTLSMPELGIFKTVSKAQMLNGDYIVDTPTHTVTRPSTADKVIVEFKNSQGMPNGKATYMVDRDDKFRIKSGRIAVDYPDGTQAIYNGLTAQEFDDLWSYRDAKPPDTVYDVRSKGGGRGISGQ